MTGDSVFRQWQPEYASRGIPTFPVEISATDKRPMVRHYMKVGSVASSRLAERFPDASAIGLMCGLSTGITVLDVDCSDEQVLGDALLRHGDTPFIVRTGSGNYQAWYRYGGEKRRVRAWGGDVPIDQLGGGYVVAPPSKGKRQSYAIMRGKLDDLSRLPFMRNAWKPGQLANPEMVGEGRRNDSLWRHCMMQVRHCDRFDDLLDVAETYNEQVCIPPLPAEEVRSVALSAWKIEERGDNRFGRFGSWFTERSVDAMVGDPHLFTLVGWLQSKNGPDARFWVADGLNETFGWSRRKFADARKRAIETNWIVPHNKPKPGSPVEFTWGKARRQS
jgi:hypothetical protein